MRDQYNSYNSTENNVIYSSLSNSPYRLTYHVPKGPELEYEDNGTQGSYKIGPQKRNTTYDIR